VSKRGGGEKNHQRKQGGECRREGSAEKGRKTGKETKQTYQQCKIQRKGKKRENVDLYIEG